MLAKCFLFLIPDDELNQIILPQQIKEGFCLSYSKANKYLNNHKGNLEWEVVVFVCGAFWCVFSNTEVAEKEKHKKRQIKPTQKMCASII